MSYFRNSTDASMMYRPSSAAGSDVAGSTAVPGNLFDAMRNSTVFRVTYLAPVLFQSNQVTPTAAQAETFDLL